MSDLVEALERVIQPIWYKGCRIEPCGNEFVVFGEHCKSLLEAKLKADTAYYYLQYSIWHGEGDEN